MYYFVQNVDKKIEMRIFEMLLMLLDTTINDKYHLIGFFDSHNKHNLWNNF